MFKIVVTTFNSASWIGQCLRSIRKQTRQDFRCVFVDDASTDGTLKEATAQVRDDERFRLIRNNKNRKQIFSIVRGIKELAPAEDDVIVQIDGDDRLKHPKVLERVQKEYSKGAWLTYGQFEYYPSGKLGPCEEYPHQIVKARDFRKYRWVGSHLKTFKYFLFKRVRRQDFLDSQGRWITSAADMAFMFPMLEMAGPRTGFIPDVLYLYNKANPLRRDRIALPDQLRCDRLIRQREKYPLLGDPNA